jgi:hypothetical protein
MAEKSRKDLGRQMMKLTEKVGMDYRLWGLNYE